MRMGQGGRAVIPTIGGQRLAGQKYRSRPGAYAILMRGRRILLTEQTAPEPDIQLPGGGIDPGESPRTALAREVFEETGYSCIVGPRLGAFRRFVWMPEYAIHAEKICHIYLAQPGLRRGPPLEPGHRAFWASPVEAMNTLGNPGDRRFLRDAVRHHL